MGTRHIEDVTISGFTPFSRDRALFATYDPSTIAIGKYSVEPDGRVTIPDQRLTDVVERACGELWLGCMVGDGECAYSVEGIGIMRTDWKNLDYGGRTARAPYFDELRCVWSEQDPDSDVCWIIMQRIEGQKVETVLMRPWGNYVALHSPCLSHDYLFVEASDGSASDIWQLDTLTGARCLLVEGAGAPRVFSDGLYYFSYEGDALVLRYLKLKTI